MAAVPPPAPDPDDAARLAVARACDALITRQHFFPIFDESKGAVDYARWRKDILQFVSPAGRDFAAALLYAGAIQPMADYADALVCTDTAASRPAVTMPQMRQHALLAVIRATLSPSGESIKLIGTCKHAGGVININGRDHDQAMRLLDQRWHRAGAPEYDRGEIATKLYTMQWPADFSVDAYNEHFNRAMTAATKINLNPTTDNDDDMALRATWWNVLARPPATSLYFQAAQQARAVTRQECTTVAHRTAWHEALIKEITTMVAAGVGKLPGGRAIGARAASAHHGGLQWPNDALTVPPGLGHALADSGTGDVAALAAVASPPPFAGAGGNRGAPAYVRRCPRCPAGPDGLGVVHARSYVCPSVAKCGTCQSDKHLRHACFIEHGLNPNVKLPAATAAEIARLHVLYKKGEFDWQTTPTTLAWMVAKRGRSAAVTASYAEAPAEMGFMDIYDELAEVASFGLVDIAADAAVHAPVAPVVAPGRVAVVAPGPAPVPTSGGISDVYSSMVAFGGGHVAAQMAAPQAPPAPPPFARPPGLSHTSLIGNCSASTATSAPSPLLGNCPMGTAVDSTLALPAPPLGNCPRGTAAQDASEPVRVLGLPTMLRLVMWGVFLIMVMVPSCAWFVRTNNDLVDAVSAVLVSWAPPRFCAFMVMVWAWVVHLHGAAVASPALVLAGVGAAGALLGDEIATTARQDVRAVTSSVVALVRSARAVRRVPWVVLALLSVGLHIAAPSPLPSLSVRSPLAALVGRAPPLSAPLPRVVHASYSTSAMIGGIVGGNATGRRGDGVDAMLAATWAPTLQFGEWVVDSGAELMIAGSFIYPYAQVLARRPDVHVKGVDGALTPVDSLCRAVVALPDGDHTVCEILVCDPFEIALWSTEYMGCFGFSALLMDSGSQSVVRTPTGCCVPLLHRPYRLLAPPRAPSAEEFARPCSLQPGTFKAMPQVPARVAGSSGVTPADVAPPCDAPHSPPLGNCSLSTVGCAVDVTRCLPAFDGDDDDGDEACECFAGTANVPPAADAPAPRRVTEKEAWRLHTEFMHAGWRTIAKTCNVIIPPMPKCTICQLTKSKRTPQPGHDTVSTFAGQLTHSDTWGPFLSALYYKGCRYMVAFVDDFTKVKLVVFCKDRTSETLLEAYKVWHAFMASLGCSPTGTWLSDGGPEYVSAEAFDFCDDHALQRLLSVRYTPTQNGSAESVFGVHIPRARAAIRACGGVKELWALAVQYSIWLSNRSWNAKLGCAPFEMVPNPPPVDVHHRRPFGCRVWAHQPDINRPDKMSDTARAGVFVGMSELYKGVIVYYPEDHSFEAVSHAKYDVDCMPMLDMAPPPPPRAPLPDPTPLPPEFVPPVKPLVAPVIPDVPPPAGLPQVNPVPPLETPPREPLMARRAMGGPMAPFADGDDERPCGPFQGQVALVPPPAPPLPRVLPPVAPVLPPRRSGSMAAADLRHPELHRAAGTPVPGSLAVVMAWLVATAPPTHVAAARAAAMATGKSGGPVVVVIFSGVQSTLPRALRDRGARVVEVDIAIGGRFHDLTDSTPDAIGWHLRRAAQRGEVSSVHAAVPCETFSVAVDDADMVRDQAHPLGLPRLTLPRANKLCLSNALMYYTIELCTDVYAAGGECTIENPSPRMDPTLPHVFWPAKAHHANLFRTSPMLAYASATGSVEITTPLCACGMNKQKYVTVLATRKAARVLAPLDGLVCTHGDHEEHAYGITSTGTPGGLESAEYPLIFAVVLACAHLGLLPPGIDTSGGSPLVVPAARAASVAVLHGSRKVPASEHFAAPRRTSAAHALVSLPLGNCTASCTAVTPPPGQSTVACLRAASQCQRVRAPGYVAPSGPGWWDDDVASDDSDDGDDEFSVLTGGVVSAYKACVKVSATAYKAAARTRFSAGPDGSTLRHDIPRGYDEAARHPEAAGIWEAMVREMNAHADCQTWTVRPASECYAMGKEPIDNMWVYDCKVDQTTSKFLLWKARLVGRGDQMVYLRDYLDTYSGVVRHATFRMFLATCAMLNLVVTGADVSTAYLHAPLRDFVVWMKLPRGFPADFNGAPALCRLNMALYGLKQSAREWAITLIEWLVAWGFVQCTSDRYMFKYVGKLGTIIMLIWVDDIFMGHDSDALRASFMTAFKARFRVKDLGRLCQALGASVSQSLSEGWVSFNLTKYITDLARRFDLHENVAWADIPVPVQLAKDCRDAKPTDAEVAATTDLYGVLAGSVVFIATFARPDVAFAAFFLSTFLVRPGQVHLKLARRVLGYLSRTRDLAITYRKGGDLTVSFSPLDLGDAGAVDETGQPHMLVDTDHGIARSITGWLFMFAGAAVSWAVRGQTMPSLSSAEAELYGLSTGVCDALTGVQVLEEMGFEFPTVTVATDSRGARLLAMDCASAARTRHIHRRWYFVRYHIDEGHLRVVLVKGSLNRSNFLTKPVGGASFASDRAYALGSKDDKVGKTAGA